ncbi:MAG: D-alanine--D-alanine ligase [Patescibacteria group bacterium]|nr:D-alanine--D-alanine ligase [Patescibacteria group bacterium]
MSQQQTIAILTGGTSSEREIALLSAEGVRSALAPCFELDVFDFPSDFDKFLMGFKKFNAVIPVFHGKGGEDGVIQGFLKTLGLPFIFSDVTAHAIALNKAFTKDVVSKTGILTPDYHVLGRVGAAEAEFDEPCVIKPMEGGSSVGISIAKTEQEFSAAIAEALKFGDEVLVERYVQGKEYTVAVIDEGNQAIALPVIAIEPKTEFFDFAAKYDAELVEEICPAPIDAELGERLKAAAVTVHRLIGARHLTRSDFIVDQDERIWFLEINTIPGQTLNSLVPKAVKASGRDMGKVLAQWIKEVAK